MTEMLSDEEFDTNSLLPSRVSAHPKGSVPTSIVSVTLRVFVLMTETVPLTMLVTYTFWSSGVMATH